jgi:hypothetical protein
MRKYSHDLKGQNQTTSNSGANSNYLPKFESYLNPLIKKTPSESHTLYRGESVLWQRSSGFSCKYGVSSI